EGLTNLYDIDRIEVLRGPQGTLYGSSAVGGTIRYLTKLPDPGAFEANVTLEYLDKNLAKETGHTLNGMVNLPITDTLAFRAVVTSGKDPGIYQNIATGRKDVGTSEDDEYRVSLRFVDGPWDLNLMYLRKERLDFGQKEAGNSDVPGTADVVDKNCDFSTGWYYGPTCNRVFATAGGDLNGYNPEVAFYSFVDEVFEVDTTTISFTGSYDFGPVVATAIYADYNYDEFYITDWSRIDTDDLYVDNLYLWGDAGAETAEFRLTSNHEGPLQWTAGYYYSKYEDAGDRLQEWEVTDLGGMEYIQSYMYFSSHDCSTGGFEAPDGSGCYNPALYRGPFGSTNYRGLDFSGGGLVYGSYIYYSYSEEKAFYGSLDYKIVDVTLTLGIRDFEISDGFKSSEYGIFYESADNTGCAGDEAVGVTCNEENGKESDQRFKYAATWEVSDNLTVFAVSSEGYRSGGNNAALPFFCANDPEAAGSFRRRFTSDAAQNNEVGLKWRGSRFNLNATVFQVDWDDIQVNIRPACGWTFTYNGGQAETKGLELEMGFDLTERLRIDFSGSVMSAEITKDIPTLDASSGDRLPNVAEKQASLGFSYAYDLMGMAGFARLDLNYYGESYATFAEDKANMSPAYTQANLNLGLQVNETTRVQLSVANLTDERTEAFRFSAESPSYRARNYLQWIPPRTIALSVSKDF
ncbi:MAG: TonB-dependent receptor domain-containing protein, partial [Steroidobacteraceae bacterium]